MAIAIRKGRTRQYVLKADRERPEGDRTIWHLRPISRRGMMKIRDGALKVEVREDGTPMGVTQLFTQRVLACRYGIEGWSNMCFEDGSEAKCETRSEDGDQVLTEGALDMILPYIDELAQEIFTMNALSEHDLGNSPPSPIPSSPAAGAM